MDKVHYILNLQEFEIAASLVNVLLFLTRNVIIVHSLIPYTEVEVYFHSFLSLALVEVSVQIWFPAALPPTE
jgi:hypothetical protein